jgi:hypothetical protein
MRVFLFFNVFSIPGQGVGNGHVRITVPEGVKITHELVLSVERQCMASGTYASFVVTGWQELEA